MAHITDVTLNGAVGSKLMDAGMSIGSNIFVGEWSCALSDTSLGTEESPINARRQFCEIQAQTYGDIGTGCTFWSEWNTVLTDVVLMVDCDRFSQREL
jgi:hypothetical protein